MKPAQHLLKILPRLRAVRAYSSGTSRPLLHSDLEEASRTHGCQQVIWLYGPDEQVTEAGAMNLFALWKDKEGQLELITPPLDSGLILPGVTRRSLLELARKWDICKVSERTFTMSDIVDAIKEKRMLQLFFTGTAVVMSPIGEIVYRPKDGNVVRLPIPTMTAEPKIMQRLFNAIVDIQYGRVEVPGWTVEC
ncbi:unnamed protein product, partial [Mesorhabditis spiculigera]